MNAILVNYMKILISYAQSLLRDPFSLLIELRMLRHGPLGLGHCSVNSHTFFTANHVS